MSKKIMGRLASGLPTFRQLMLDERIISESQASVLDKLCHEGEVNFATALMFKGYCSIDKLSKLLEERVSIRRFPLKSIPGLGKVRNLISEEKSKELQIFPLTLIEESGQKVILLGMTDPLDVSAVRKIEFLTHMKVQPAFLPLDDLQALYIKFFRRGLEIFPAEVTFYGEKASSSRANAVMATPAPEVLANVDKERFQALVNLLVKKGIFTFSELENEVQSTIRESQY